MVFLRKWLASFALLALIGLISLSFTDPAFAQVASEDFENGKLEQKFVSQGVVEFSPLIVMPQIENPPTIFVNTNYELIEPNGEIFSQPFDPLLHYQLEQGFILSILFVSLTLAFVFVH